MRHDGMSQQVEPLSHPWLISEAKQVHLWSDDEKCPGNSSNVDWTQKNQEHNPQTRQ